VLSVFVLEDWNVVISPIIKVLSCYKAVEDVELSIAASCMLMLLFNAVSTKSYIFCKVRVHVYHTPRHCKPYFV